MGLGLDAAAMQLGATSMLWVRLGGGVADLHASFGRPFVAAMVIATSSQRSKICYLGLLGCT